VKSPVDVNRANGCIKGLETHFGKRFKKRFLRFVCGSVILALSAFSMKAITLVWNANTDPDLVGYTVYSGTNSHVYNKSTYVGNVTSNTPAALIPGTTYYFAITAKNTSGLESDFSNEIAVDVPPSLGQPVAATTQLVSGKMKLSWPSTLSSTYRVYYKTKLTDATWNQLTTTDLLAVSTTTSWTDPNLANAPSRFYRVVNVPPSLGQPVAATTQLVSGKMKLSWPSTLSSTYRVYYKTKLTDATWTQLTSDLLAAGTTTSWTDPTLANAPSRFYRVFKVA
jgi:hypothetical protein